jgi:hypothetical protein
MADKLAKIQNMIYEIRGLKVMLDGDLSVLYQVETKYLNRTVKRHLKRFPADSWRGFHTPPLWGGHNV